MTVLDTAPGAPAGAREPQVEPYDFRRPLTLVREHARHLEMAFGRLARQFGTQLTARLRAVSSLELEQIALHTYEEYVGGLPTPTAMVLCTVDPTRQTAVLQLPVAATMVWVDYLFGGDGRGDDRPGRELTEIEMTLVRELLEHALADMEYAFAGITRLGLEIRGVQYNPQFVQAAAATDAVLVATFRLRVGEREDTLTLMLPGEHMVHALQVADGVVATSPEDRRKAMVAHADLATAVAAVPVEVGVRFAPVTVQPRDVLTLAVGDVLPLTHPSTEPLDVVVDDVVLAKAAIGSHGPRLACRVVAVTEENRA
ncbi:MULTISPECIES: flagellar motor switch protein FliM [Cellulomonas]|uniref:Flagellar motor switch protein FliM n=1 Tax=Cellulomonas gelida TaxID=1712 RepID=A0A4Y3KN65_9CELL|nr:MULTISPECIES: flagellar motor switch protein FliM [Cellulomonas]MCR6705589.1 flagellar motor switch protein FliM [Cellulomonas sp.]GEA85851.1 flagellar motor switch protein FliM [Cellulomonas gelida]GGL16770.1 flagellar motor switch protein FliM [Cellulomonas gelida]